MTSIKNTYVCPRCDEGISSTNKPDYCPACGFHMSAEVDTFFLPHTVSEQMERINDKIAHADFVVNLPISNAKNMMNDALHIIQTIGGKKVLPSDIRELVGMAIRIGEVAKKYEEFLAAGGSHTPGLFIVSGEKHEQQQNTDGGKTTAPVPTPLFAPLGKDE